MYYQNRDGSDDEEEQDEMQSWGGRDAMIFLVDANIEPRNEEGSGFHLVCDLIEATMMNRIITSEKDLIGIVFYNTEHSPLPMDDQDEAGLPMVPPNSAVFMTLKQTSAETVKFIKRFKEQDFFDFDTKYGRSDQPANLADVLQLCSKLFTRCGYKLQDTTILLMTMNPQPHPHGSQEEQLALMKAADLCQLRNVVMLVPICDEFDVEPFYKEFLCKVTDQDPETFAFEQPTLQRAKLLGRIFRRTYKKRCMSHLKLRLGETADKVPIEISVGLYSTFRRVKPPKKVTLLRDTNEVVTAKRFYRVGTRTVGDDDEDDPMDSTRHLLPGEQIKSQRIGNETIAFTSEELQKMRQLLPSGIVLLGFKPRTEYSPHEHFRAPLFMYPDEGTIKGSTTLFRALWEKCLEKEQIAYCILTLKRLSPPRLAALIPQEEIRGEDNVAIRSDGFIVEFVPYASDIRDLDFLFEKDPPEVPEGGVDLFKRLMKKLKFVYDPDVFHNPVIRTKYANIEAIVFEKDSSEVEDTTLPDFERQDARVAPFLDSLVELFGENVAVVEKRSAKTSDGPRAKVAKMDANPDSNEIERLAKEGNLEKLSVAVLKGYLQGRGEKGLSALKKAQLIDRIKALNGV